MGFMTLKTGSKCIIKSDGIQAEIQCIESGKYKLKGYPGVFTASELKTVAFRPESLKRSSPIKKSPLKKQNTPVSKTSDKQRHLNDFYKALLGYRNAKISKCAINLPGCRGIGDETHHQYKRSGFWLIVFKYTIPVCRNCHSYITENSEFAIENGYSISRFTQLNYEIPQHEFDFLWKNFHNCREKSTLLTKIKCLFTISP